MLHKTENFHLLIIPQWKGLFFITIDEYAGQWKWFSISFQPKATKNNFEAYHWVKNLVKLKTRVMKLQTVSKHGYMPRIFYMQEWKLIT